MNMDIHNKFKTDSHQKITCRFNERLILSLADCKRCLVLDDQLTILPISSKTAIIELEDVSFKFYFKFYFKIVFSFCKVENTAETPSMEQLNMLKETLKDTPPAGQLVQICKTYDQGKAVSQFIDTLTTKALR